jgi:membrane protease YdiL (CAAX protease family)
MKPKPSLIAFTAWTVLALAALVPVTSWLGGSFPIFTVVWIVVPAIFVWRAKDAAIAGFRTIPWRSFLPAAALNLGGLLALMLLFEPWSHTYRKLLEIVLSSPTPDTTFAWLVRFPRLPALAAMTLYSGAVTLFGEELFFRGWLLQLLRRRWGTAPAILLQSLLFVVPNLLVAFALPTLQGWLYGVVYTWVAIGLLGGWSAARTGSLWPSLLSATVSNLVLVMTVLR